MLWNVFPQQEQETSTGIIYSKSSLLVYVDEYMNSLRSWYLLSHFFLDHIFME